MLWQYILNVPEHDANIKKGNIRISRILPSAMRNSESFIFTLNRIKLNQEYILFTQTSGVALVR